MRARLLDLIDADAEVDDGGDQDGTQGSETVLGLIKSMPGNVSLESMMTEISKLEAVRPVALVPSVAVAIRSIRYLPALTRLPLS